MKLKQSLTIVFLSAGLLHAGFFDHDKEYYDKHPKEAKSKVDLCEKAVTAALQNGDMKLAEKYNKDDECVAAAKSYEEYQEKLRRAKYEAQEKKRKEKIAKKKAIFDAEYKNDYDIYKKADFETFYKDYDKCIRRYIEKGDSIVLNDKSEISKDAQCQAWKDLKNEKDKAQLDYVLKTYQKEALIKYKDKKCGFRSRDFKNCEIARKAYKIMVEKQKKYYAEHKGLLEKDFNECHNKYMKLFTSNKFNKADELGDTYKCKMASEVANRDISQSFK